MTAALGQQLQNLIPTCSAIIKTLPDGAPGRPRLRALITTAEHALQRGPGHGATAALVHMQLLADSTHHLAEQVRQASERGVLPTLRIPIEPTGDRQPEAHR